MANVETRRNEYIFFRSPSEDGEAMGATRSTYHGRAKGEYGPLNPILFSDADGWITPNKPRPAAGDG